MPSSSYGYGTVLDRTREDQFARRGVIFQMELIELQKVVRLIQILLHRFEFELEENFIEDALDMRKRGTVLQKEFWTDPIDAARWLFIATQSKEKPKRRLTLEEFQNTLEFLPMELEQALLPFRHGGSPEHFKRLSQTARLGHVTQLPKSLWSTYLSLAAPMTSMSELFRRVITSDDRLQQMPHPNALTELVSALGLERGGGEWKRDLTFTLTVVSDTPEGIKATHALRPRWPKIEIRNIGVLTPSDSLFTEESKFRENGADQVYFSGEELWNDLLETVRPSHDDEDFV